MFLIDSLLVVVFVYWFSAFLAETLLRSRAEKTLPPIVRIGFGFFLSVVYFSSTWQVMPMQQAWILGVVLLLSYTYGRYGLVAFTNGTKHIECFIRIYKTPFIFFIIASVVFFAPNIISKKFGPFTEGGGDITIYADTAKLLTDHNMTSLGEVSPTIEGQKRTVRNLLDFTSVSRYEKFAEIQEKFYLEHSGNLNPPIADNGAYRIVLDTFFPSIHYAPYAQFYFLAGETNYGVYFGIQAFLYAILLGCIWGFFSIFSRRLAVIAVVLVASSHSLVSVYYNHYSMQGISLAATALILAAIPIIGLASTAACRTYGSICLVITVLYTHFLAIIIPFMLLALFTKNKEYRDFSRRSESFNSRCRKIIWSASTISFLLFSALFLVSNSQKSIAFVKGLLLEFLSQTKSIYLGDQIPYLSMQWLGFLFGFLSQQHYYPFASEKIFVKLIIALGVISGILILLIGLWVVTQIRPKESSRPYFYLAIYVTASLIVCSHLYVSGNSLYTQAKGAQNVLVYFYLVILLPLALGLAHPEATPLMRKALKLMKLLTIILILSLLVPRSYYLSKLSANEDRASILDFSYFKESSKILEIDPNAFVLFEPRKSADLYISIQPFAGSRMVPTRHLALESLQRDAAGITKKTQTLALDLIKNEDISALWVLRNKKTDAGNRWVSERLMYQQEPYLLLSAHNYERSLEERVVHLQSGQTGRFSYLRNGVASLYVPSGKGGQLEVTLEPRDRKDYTEMVKNIEDQLAAGKLSGVLALKKDGTLLRLTYRILVQGQPILKRIAHYSGEFWLNVKLNGEDL